jgi:putative ABC transport system permease protein
MLKNYLKTAYRNLTRNLNYTAINILGLAFGMACCFVITLYVRFELSFEDFHVHKNEIYRYIPKSSNKGELAMQTYTPAGMAPRFKNDFPEIVNYSRHANFSDEANFKYKGKLLGSGKFCIADSGFFGMFSIPLLKGEAGKVLSRPSTIVISRSMAESFFGDTDPIGETIEFDGKMSFEITGIFEDVPANSHLSFSYLGSFTSLPVMMESLYLYKNDKLLEDMGAWNYTTYLHIPHGVSSDLERRMSEKLYMYQSNDTKIPENFQVDWLQPLGDIHFTRGIKGDSGGTGSMSYVYVFSSVAIFVLLIACFNFMNLSTALALTRAKEVGLRKSIGATRRQLMLQFIGESALLIIVSVVLALQIVWLVLPSFNSLMDLSLNLDLLGDPAFLSIVILIAGFTALTGGAYPSFYLSSFAPSKVLKGDKISGGKTGLRKVLTVVQFAIATFMIIGTSVVFQQMAHMRNSSLGFEKEHVITFPATIELHQNYDRFKERILKHSSVQAVTICNGVPGSTLGHWRYSFPGQERDGVSVNTVATDFDYTDVMGLQLVDGRKLSKEHPSDDSLSYLINETAAKEFFLDKPVGTRFKVEDGAHPEGTIVGVAKDYHFRSLQHKVDPLVIRVDRNNAFNVAVKVNSENYKETLAFIKSEWSQISPNNPFDYSFLDESYDQLYKSEEKTGILMSAFSFLAIFVASLGLTGLASFLTQQRRKEISIRKVHGASVQQVVALLSWDFIKLVLIGFALVVPFAWYAVKQWLMNFAYQVDVSPVLFIVAGVLVALIAFVTVGYQSYKASVTNPASVLREP